MSVIEIADADIVPIEEFSLRWRFTRQRADRWPVEALRRLRPLSPAAAAILAPRAAGACVEQGTFGTTFRSDDPPDVVRKRLAALPPGPMEPVLLSWDARTAAVADWDLFVACWDDFCYPSSDDVTVMSLAGAWVLCYRHYEVIQFRER